MVKTHSLIFDTNNQDDYVSCVIEEGINSGWELSLGQAKLIDFIYQEVPRTSGKWERDNKQPWDIIRSTSTRRRNKLI